jgi:hypothetical protein
MLVSQFKIMDRLMALRRIFSLVAVLLFAVTGCYRLPRRTYLFLPFKLCRAPYVVRFPPSVCDESQSPAGGFQ